MTTPNFLDGLFGGSGGSNSVELAFNAGVANSTSATYARIGARKIDMTPYPATIGTLTRIVKLVAALDRGAGATSAQVKLYNITAGEDVTGASLTSTSLSNFEQSVTLTVGTSAGNVRSDSAAQYEVYLKMNGGTPGTDIATCTNARIVISYA